MLHEEDEGVLFSFRDYSSFRLHFPRIGFISSFHWCQLFSLLSIFESVLIWVKVIANLDYCQVLLIFNKTKPVRFNTYAIDISRIVGTYLIFKYKCNLIEKKNETAFFLLNFKKKTWYKYLKTALIMFTLYGRRISAPIVM